MKQLKVGSDFSGVGAFDQALRSLEVPYKTIFSCDMDKYARRTYIHNYGEPDYYPENVYDREIPKEPLDIYMTSPPCQAFSLAGKRKGEDDQRGILFYNSHEFIKVNNPRYFIFENVKGLLSDDGGRTFQRWLDFLGGKTVNGNPVIFPHEESVLYHIYWQVLNAKDYGVPQNRERVFIIGIRDDGDNNFSFPKPFPLAKRLKDVLETDVDEKYFLSEKMIAGLTLKTEDAGYINQDTQASQVHSIAKESPTISAGTHGYANGYVQVKSATACGYELATEEDSINFSVPNSETRRGRVGKGVAQTLDTSCNQGVINRIGNYSKSNHNASSIVCKDGISPAVMENHGTVTATKISNSLIRKLTPRECFRLMDFPDTFTWPVSDSQAYKQAGNSIVVNVLAQIISKLQLK